MASTHKLSIISHSYIQMKKHDHVRPNPSNPLVTIKRDGPADLSIAPQLEANLRADPSKGGKITALNAPTPPKPSLPLPERFKQPEIWNELAQRQHPLYRTSSHVYGEKPPAIQEMPNKVTETNRANRQSEPSWQSVYTRCFLLSSHLIRRSYFCFLSVFRELSSIYEHFCWRYAS